MHRRRRGSAGGKALLAAMALVAGCNAYAPSLLELGVSGASSGGDSASSGTAGADAGVAGNDTVEGGAPTAAAGVDGLGDGGVAAGGDAEGGGGSAGVGVGGSQMGGAGSSGAAANGGGGSSASGAGGKTGGAGGKAGSGGTAGSAGMAGSAGTTASAMGCAKLSVPLNEGTDKAHFVITLTTPVDMSRATISMRLYVQAGSGGTIFNYVQDSGTYHFFGTPTAKRYSIGSFNGWSSFAWDVGAEPVGSSDIVKTSIKNIGIELNAQPSSSWSDPTVIYVDSITVKTPTLSFSFDAASSVAGATVEAPGQALWINPGATDTTATGTTATWQASCP